MGPLSNLHRKARELLGLSPAVAAEGLPAGSIGHPGLIAGEPSPAAPNAVPVDQSIRYRAPHRDEMHLAIRLLLSTPARVAEDSQVSDFLRMASARRLDLQMLRIAERRGRLLWAVLPVVSPGRTALLLCPPAPARESDHAVAVGMVDALCDELQARGIDLTQTLIDPEDTPARALFEEHGFEAMAELLYLSAEPRRRSVAPPLPPGLQWMGYGPATHEQFKQTIAATYTDSLDCPALNGRRDMEDVMAGHQASGEFAPALWRMLCEMPTAGHSSPRPLGVLLLSRIPQSSTVELVYLGLVPSARGRRLGDLLVKTALAGVAESGMSRLTLAVDAQNAPALQLYYRNGLSRMGSKRAMMRDLRKLAPGIPPACPT